MPKLALLPGCVISQYVAVGLAEFSHVEVEVKDCGAECIADHALFCSGCASACLCL
jgi:hypothetical protein